MTAKHDALLQQVAQNDALVNRLQADLDTAKRQQRELHAQALKLASTRMTLAACGQPLFLN